MKRGQIVRYWHSDVPPHRVLIKWRDNRGKAWVMEYQPTEPEPDLDIYESRVEASTRV